MGIKTEKISHEKNSIWIVNTMIYWIWIKPTGKRLVFTGVDIDKVIDGLIVEHGGAVNTFETLFEAGMIGAIWFLE